MDISLGVVVILFLCGGFQLSDRAPWPAYLIRAGGVHGGVWIDRVSPKRIPYEKRLKIQLLKCGVNNKAFWVLHCQLSLESVCCVWSRNKDLRITCTSILDYIEVNPRLHRSQSYFHVGDNVGPEYNLKLVYRLLTGSTRSESVSLHLLTLPSEIRRRIWSFSMPETTDRIWVFVSELGHSAIYHPPTLIVQKNVLRPIKPVLVLCPVRPPLQSLDKLFSMLKELK